MRPTAEGFAPLGLSHEKGTDKHTDRRTCQLLDQLGPEGRVGEKRRRSKGSKGIQRATLDEPTKETMHPPQAVTQEAFVDYS